MKRAIAALALALAACGDADAPATQSGAVAEPPASPLDRPAGPAQTMPAASAGGIGRTMASEAGHEEASGEARALPAQQLLSTAPIFQRTPSELPRADFGRWSGVYDSAGPDSRPSPLSKDETKLLAMAGTEFLRRDFGPALEKCYALLTAEPEFPPAMLLLGTLYFKLRRYEDSIHCHERFLAHAPGEVGKTQALAHCYYSLGKYAQARDHYLKVLASNADSPEAIRGLGLSYMRLGEDDQALAQLRRVMELRPNHAEAQGFIAQILFDRGESEQALAAAQHARDLDPNEPRPWHLISLCLYELGRDAEAKDADQQWRVVSARAEEVRTLEARLAYRPPNSYSIALRLLEIHRDSKNALALREAIDRLFDLKPPGIAEVDVRILALDALVTAGDGPGALNAARVLEKSCPDSIAAWKRLEAYYGGAGDPENCIRAGERWRRLNSGG